MIKRDKTIEVMKMIEKDVEMDAAEFDGKPFTGRTMAEYMGNHGAAIAAVARAVRTILEETK